MDHEQIQALLVKHRTEYEIARIENADRWVPANGGTELPFTMHGRRFLYVYNHATGENGYLNMDQDIVYPRLE